MRPATLTSGVVRATLSLLVKLLCTQPPMRRPLCAQHRDSMRKEKVQLAREHIELVHSSEESWYAGMTAIDRQKHDLEKQKRCAPNCHPPLP